MKIVIAMDSFKGCLSSPEAGQAAREGILHAGFGDEVLVRPLADGGEGTLETLAQGLGGRMETVRVCGPLGTPVDARYAVLPGGTAVIETAQAAGLPLVPPGARDPLHATTFGVGELIRHAVRGGCRRFLLGLGLLQSRQCFLIQNGASLRKIRAAAQQQTQAEGKHHSFQELNSY